MKYLIITKVFSFYLYFFNQFIIIKYFFIFLILKFNFHFLFFIHLRYHYLMSFKNPNLIKFIYLNFNIFFIVQS